MTAAFTFSVALSLTPFLFRGILMRTFLFPTAVMMFAATAFAQDKPASALVTRNQTKLNLKGADLILAAAQEQASSMKLAMNIAVVDDGGHLIAFARMDGARPASGYTALTKATSAATFRQATGPLPATGEPNLLLSLSLAAAAGASGGKGTALKGGVPIVIEGQVVGAVGVGGGTGEQDIEVAQAGIEALINALKPATKAP